MHTFLPKTPPIRNYKTKTKSLSNLTKVASELPKLLLTNKVQKTINNLSLHKVEKSKFPLIELLNELPKYSSLS